MGEERCIKCGKIICPAKARFYKNPLNKLCSKCRKRELEKEIVIARMKQREDNVRLSIG